MSSDGGVERPLYPFEPLSSSPPINDTPFRRFLVLFGLGLLRPFQTGPVRTLTPWVCVKSGSFRDLVEARTMQFVASNTTSIPVPKVYCSFRRKGITYIAMERIHGQKLTTAWHTLSQASREKVFCQLREITQEMRRLPPPNTRISNIEGGSLWDCRLSSNLRRCGPFEDIPAFHRFLRNDLSDAPPGYPEIEEMIQLHNREWGPPIFTHGDLSSLNILVRGDTIVGIVDWETAGWWPPYWEYTTALQVNIRNLFWKDWVEKFLDPWPEALKMETVRQRWWRF